MKQLFKLLLNSFPIDFTRFIYKLSLRRIYKDKNAGELSYYVSRKRNAKKKYVVLRFSFLGQGIFAIIRKLIFTMDYWEKRHFIPLVDYESDDYLASDVLGEHNIWEQCFKQKKCVREISKEDYVLVEDVNRYRAGMKTCLNINGDYCDIVELKRDGWRAYYKKVNQYLVKWLVKSDLVENVLERDFYSKKSEQEIMLGVMMREEFSEEAYQLMPEERRKIIDLHPRVPDVDETIEIVEQYMKKYQIDKIFLSTMMIETVEKFKNRFEDKVIYIKRERTTMESYKVNYTEISSQELREETKKVWGDSETEIPVKYVSEIYALAECDYLLAAPSGGAVGALMINGGKYKDIKILDDLNQSKFYK